MVYLFILFFGVDKVLKISRKQDLRFSNWLRAHVVLSHTYEV